MVRTSLNTSLRKRKKPKTPPKDRLSELPCDVLQQILSHLSTKDSYGTRVLSRRWKNLWLNVPALDLDEGDFEDDGFIDYFLEKNRNIKRFKWIYNVNAHLHDEFVWRLKKVVKRGVTHFTVENHVHVDEDLVRMPLSLYSCSTLVHLSLNRVVLDHPKSKLVSLPCLKYLYLEAVIFDDGCLEFEGGCSVLETLVSSCPVLESLTVITHTDDDLEVVDHDLEVVCIRSQSLKYFSLWSQRRLDDKNPSVEIDAPRLEYLSITDYQPESFVIRNIASSAMLNLDVGFNVDHDDPCGSITKIRNFLSTISIFKNMTISAQTLEALNDYSEEETLPRFSNLSSLDASLVESSWQYLQAFFSCCMNLHSLILELDPLPDKEDIEEYPLPQCVVSSLESLKLKTPETPSKMILARYFMMNCPALKKMF